MLPEHSGKRHTVYAMSTILQNTQSVTPWLVCPSLNPEAKLRLFCFPYAGGGAAIYQTWPDNLPSTVEVCPVQLPGRGARMHEMLFNHVQPLASAAIEALLPYFDKPFAFFGHSMGALLSFEISRQLRKMGYGFSPSHLFISGRGAPQLPDTDPPRHDLPGAEFMAELRRLNGTPPEILENQELMQLMVPLLRADFAVCETYVYTEESPLDCPITVMGGLYDVDVGRDRLEAWREQTTGAFMLRVFPGDHFFLRTAQPLLLQILYKDLHQLVKSVA